MSRDTYDYQGERLDSDRRRDDVWEHDLQLARTDRALERTGHPTGQLEREGARGPEVAVLESGQPRPIPERRAA